jgi:hypothetical protein
MTEQNPPSGQPTPPPGEPEEPTQPVEGVGPTAHEGSAPPPPGEGETTTFDQTPPPPPGETTTFDQAPPPPPPPAKRSKAPWIIGIAVVLVLVLVGGAITAILQLKGDDKHAIAIPSSAGGMKRDTGKEAELKQQLDAAEQQFKSQAKNVSYVKSGVYNQADKAKGPEGALVFLGAKLKTVQSPTAFVNSFGKQAGSNGFKIDKISAGDGGGKAVCASQATGQKVAICAWATKDSMGELIPTVPGWEADKLATIMLALRADVEKTE